MPYFSDDAYNRINPNAPFGCINGGGIYDHRTKEYVWKQPIDPTVSELVSYIQNAMPDIGIQLNTFEHVYFLHDNDSCEWFRDVTGMPYLPCELEGFDEPLAKVVFSDFNENAIAHVTELLAAHPRAGEFDFIRSERSLYEILPKGIDKGTVLPLLAKHLGISMDKTIAVGDYNNDIGMIRAAGLGIAVANAVDSVKAVADHVTVSNEESAIARIIYDVESGKLKI
jgi:Cof subfamily protein (haloacid dehalogenase superfamily)